MADGRTLKLGRGFSLPLDLVTEATAIVATRGAGKSSASAVIVEEIFGLGVQSVTFDRTGVYWGLRSNAKGDGAGLAIYVLGGAHGDVPLEPHAGVLIADLVVDSGHSFVLDLSDFSKGQAVRFAADFLERIYDRKARARTTTLIVMDEAHFYAPQTPRGGFKGDAARLMGAMEDVVGLGRSRGLGVILTTQRTQSLNKAVLDLIETLFVMRMLSPRAREAVKGWIQEKHEDDERGVIATLNSLPDGTAWVWSPLRGILEKVALRRIKTFNSFATPEPGQDAVEPSVRKELDLTALGEQMQATAERAKENDPVELKKRVRELEQDLATREREIVTVEKPVEVRVEVPVFTDADREALKHIRGAIEGLTEQSRNVADVTGLKLAEMIERIEGIQSTPPKPPPPVIPPVRPAEPERSAVGIVADTRKREVEQVAVSANGRVDASGQKILDAIRWYAALGIPQPTKLQVGFVAGYKVGGRFNNLLGGLRSSGLVTYPQGGTLALTDEGYAYARDPGLPATNDAMQSVMRDVIARGRDGASLVRILDVLLARWPEPISKDLLAMDTGYSIGGRFNNLCGALRTLGLAEYPEPGAIRATDVLFPVRS